MEHQIALKLAHIWTQFLGANGHTVRPEASSTWRDLYLHNGGSLFPVCEEFLSRDPLPPAYSAVWSS